MSQPSSAERGHWWLVALLLVAIGGALVLTGYARHDLGRAGTGATGATAPLPHAVVYGSTYAPGTLRSRALADHTVALTFDDGPDTRWTPQVLAALRAAQVPATFFVVGSRAASHLGLVRREARQGNEVAAHTFTHASLEHLPAWRRRLELSLTQLALAGATGHVTAFVRPPYSSTPESVTSGQRAAMQTLTRDGYVVVLSDRDTDDWRRPGVAQIVDRATADLSGAGQIVLMHDAGGNRAQTVAALPELIARYRAAGYTFVTVAQGLGLDDAAGSPRAEGSRRFQGVAFLVALRGSLALSSAIAWLLVPLGVLALLRTVILLALAGSHKRHAWRRIGEEWWLPPVTVLVPAYNEAVGIEASIRSLRASDYPSLEILVIDDGSTDGTADIVNALALPGVRVITQPNAGKAAALSRGYRESSSPVLVMVDGDTVFAPDAVRWLVQPLRDPTVGAVSGNTKVGNRRRLLGRWQHIEYVIGFNLDRRAYDLMRCMPTVPGAIGAFRRDALDAVGGVPSDTLAEDTDLTMSIVRAGWHVVYEERAHALTEAPATLSALWHQRYRWCYGTLQAVWKHRAAMLGRTSDRRLGFIGLPYLLLFQVALPLIAPLIDVYAVYGLVFLDPVKVGAYWAAFLLLQLVAGGYALHLDRESLRVLWVLPLQQLVYRQLMYLVVIESVVSAARGSALRWHKLERTGLDEVATGAG